MIKEIQISIPTTWSDVKLKKWLELQKEVDNYKDDEDAVSALMLYHLCGLSPEYASGIAVDDYVMIRNDIANFINNVDLPFQRFIYIDGVEYGFEPNLSNMTYGAFADITKYNTIQIDYNWANIMSILYRPVDKRQGDMYTIKPYTGELNPKLFLEVGMDIHFGCLFFFVNLLKNLQSSILKSTMEMELPQNIRLILGKNGERIQQLLNLQEETSLKLTK
jgi:hypothetical protein